MNRGTHPNKLPKCTRLSLVIIALCLTLLAWITLVFYIVGTESNRNSGRLELKSLKEFINPKFVHLERDGYSTDCHQGLVNSSIPIGCWKVVREQSFANFADLIRGTHIQFLRNGTFTVTGRVTFISTGGSFGLTIKVDNEPCQMDTTNAKISLFNTTKSYMIAQTVPVSCKFVEVKANQKLAIYSMFPNSIHKASIRSSLDIQEIRKFL